MNKNQIAGRWDEMKGKIKAKWGDLTDDEIAMAEGRRDEFIGKVRAKYGDAEQDIRRQFDEWERDRDGARRN
jgi:uncharacterized protein YjbJ (UPF0337 family)